MVVQVFGLSIVKEILNKNNGKIDISSEFGKGTEVIIRFNIKSKPDIEENPNNKTIVKIRKPKSKINKRRNNSNKNKAYDNRE